MPGELGLLLGQYGGAQSLESVSSWALPSAACSLSIQATDVHSSPRGGQLDVFSGGAGALRYDYAFDNDAYQRWSPDVSTHSLVAMFWARASKAAGSGQVSAVWTGGTSVPIPFTATLQPYVIRTTVKSGDSLKLDFAVKAGWAADSYSLFLDDVTVAVDNFPVLLDPATQRLRQMQLAQHNTLGGRRVEYVWHQRGQWQVTHLAAPSSLVDLVNRWHTDGRPLLWVPDSSDTAQRYVAGLVGGQPAVGPTAPYPGASDLNLALSAYRSSLVF